MRKLYPYPCEESDDCFVINENPEMSFSEFCQHYCANCPDVVFLDIPYEAAEKRKDGD